MPEHEQLTLFEAFYTGTPRIIGLSGKLGSGKDTVCLMLQELRSDINLRRDAFADRLKLSAARALGINGEVEESLADINNLKQKGHIIIVFEDEGVVGNITGRQFLQLYGTEAHRQIFGEGFWSRQVLNYESGPPYYGQPPFDVLIITDVRFDDEARWIKACGGEIWRVERDTAEDNDHASEAGISDELVSRTIENNGTLEELRQQLEELCHL